MDGKELLAAMAATGVRTAERNELTVSFGGRVMIRAAVRIDERSDPIGINYLNRSGPADGQVQLGILRWEGDALCTVMAAPGRPRPTEFSSPAGSGHTLSRWRRSE